MKKQHSLLTTVLAGSMLYSPFASAFNLDFNTNNNFVIDGVEYQDLNAAVARIEVLVDNDQEPDFPSIDSIGRLAQHLVDDANFRAQLINIANNAINAEIDINQVNAFFNEVSAIFQENNIDFEDAMDYAYGYISQYGEEDFFHLLADIMDDPTIITQIANEVGAAYRYENIAINSNAETIALKTQADTLEAQIDTLQAAAGQVDQNALQAAQSQLKAKYDELYSRADMNSFVVSKENQENLKNLVHTIKALQKSGQDQAAQKMIDDLALKIAKYAPNVTNAKNLSPIQTPETKTTESMFDATRAIGATIDRRISNVTGVAAGNMIEHVGLWLKATMSVGEKKPKGLSDGYKFDAKAVTLGGDISIEDHLLGAAYSYSNNHVKSKLNNSVKDEIPMHMFSVYGALNFGNLFTNGQVNYGIAKLNKKRAAGDIDGNILTGKPKANSLGGSVVVGYDYALEGMGATHLIPTAGVSYSRQSVNKYTETGAGLTRTVDKRNLTRTSGLLGLAVKQVVQSGDMDLIPEIHANLDYAFNNKSSDTKVTILNGLNPIVVPAEKQMKGLYNVGAALEVVSNKAFETGIGYDYNFGNKYKSHTGSIKVRVNL